MSFCIPLSFGPIRQFLLPSKWATHRNTGTHLLEGSPPNFVFGPLRNWSVHWRVPSGVGALKGSPGKFRVGHHLHLLKGFSFVIKHLFSLLGLQGIHTYWKYVFSWGLSQTEDCGL